MIDKETFQKIKEEYCKKQNEIFKKALETYPSKHLLDNEEEWNKALDQQSEYQAKEQAAYGEILQKKFNLTSDEWEEVLAYINIQNFKTLQDNPIYKKALKELKNKKRMKEKIKSLFKRSIS